MDFQKVVPKWVLILLLVYVSILFTYAIFDGRQVDFWPPIIHEKSSISSKDSSHEQDIANLKIEFSKKQSNLSQQETLNMLPEQVRRNTIKETTDEILNILNTVFNQNAEIAQLKEKVKGIESIEGDFLFRVLTFHNKARCYGDSLNFTHVSLDPSKCTKKEALAKRFLSFLSEVEFYDGPVVESTEIAKSQLIKYQESKSFGRKGWYGKDIFIWIITDYIRKA